MNHSYFAENIVTVSHVCCETSVLHHGIWRDATSRLMMTEQNHY
jgi:hypothetical protein